MKTTSILTTFIFLLFCRTNAQMVDDPRCTDFESPASFVIIDTTGIWEIDTPQKTIFDSSYQSALSIVTDAQNPYPTSDTSYFYTVYKNVSGGVWNYLGVYAPLQVQFHHRFDMDSLADFGAVDISVDGGSTWVNMLEDLSHYLPFYKDIYNSHIYESTGDTIYDSLTVTGTSNGWIQSTVTAGVNEVNEQNWYQIDSVIVRFALYTDSVENFREGWQIDDLCLIYKLGGLIFSVDELEAGNISLYPNPASNVVHLFLPQANTTRLITVTDALGKKIYRQETSDSEFKVPVEDIPAGMYWLTVQARGDSKMYSGKLLIAH